MTLSILHETTPDQLRKMLESPGVQYVREGVAESLRSGV
jgi:hypothetical protein